MQAHGFRVFFTPLPEVLFTFPSRYSSTVGLPVVFSLAGWSPRFRAGFLVSCATQVAALPGSAFRLRGFHPLRPAFPRRSATLHPAFYGRSYYPGGRVATPPVWAPPLSLAATGGIICLFSFPAGTEMFQFPALAPLQVVSLRTGSPIRTPADLSVFAGPRGFSQLVTSFFASGSLRHPPCALVCFPCFLFPCPAGFYSGAALSLGFAFTLCVYTMSMTSPLGGE